MNLPNINSTSPVAKKTVPQSDKDAVLRKRILVGISIVGAVLLLMGIRGPIANAPKSKDAEWDDFAQLLGEEAKILARNQESTTTDRSSVSAVDLKHRVDAVNANLGKAKSDIESVKTGVEELNAKLDRKPMQESAVAERIDRTKASVSPRRAKTATGSGLGETKITRKPRTTVNRSERRDSASAFGAMLLLLFFFALFFVPIGLLVFFSLKENREYGFSVEKAEILARDQEYPDPDSSLSVSDLKQEAAGFASGETPTTIVVRKEKTRVVTDVRPQLNRLPYQQELERIRFETERKQALQNRAHMMGLSRKDPGTAFALTFFLGPLGMIYSAPIGACVMFVATLVSLALCFALIGFLLVPCCWIVQIAWSMIAVQQYNSMHGFN